MEGFSDGVVGFAITLLVLDIALDARPVHLEDPRRVNQARGGLPLLGIARGPGPG